MPAHLKRRHGGKIWYVTGSVTVWKDGEPHRIPLDKSTGTSDQEEADAIKDQIVAKIKRQTITGKEASSLFGELVVSYLEDGGDARFLEKPMDYYEFTPFDEITDEMIIEDGRVAYPGRKASTIRRNWDTPIRAVLRHHTAPKRRKAEDEGRIYFFTPEQADKLIEAYSVGRYATDLWGRALITFLFGQGSRVGETLSIDAKDDLSLQHGYAILRDTKNKSQRKLTLIPRVVTALRTLPNIGEPGPLFRRFDGKPFAEKVNRGGQIRTRFNRAVADIGMNPRLYTPHVCRHSWATWFYSQTKDEKRLRDEGGWKSDQYRRYVQLSSTSLGEEAQKRNWGFGRESHDWRSGVREVNT
ncbi:MAG: tyrosine-type recombinase/integrase [Pseudomonadota bacterium]